MSLHDISTTTMGKPSNLLPDYIASYSSTSNNQQAFVNKGCINFTKVILNRAFNGNILILLQKMTTCKCIGSCQLLKRMGFAPHSLAHVYSFKKLCVYTLCVLLTSHPAELNCVKKNWNILNTLVRLYKHNLESNISVEIGCMCRNLM